VRAREAARDDALGALLQRCVAGRCHCAGGCESEDRTTRAIPEPPRSAGLMLSRDADPKQCCAENACERPDAKGSGAEASNWKLVLAVDREETDWGLVANPEDVGHTWVKLSDDTGERWSYGMWPEQGFEFFSAVKGCVHHPDTEHDPPASTDYREISYDLTRTQYYDALEFAQQQCQLKPDYHLQKYNCTTFAISTALAAGVKPPASTTLAVHNPNALYTGIGKELAKRKRANAKAKKGGGAEVMSANVKQDVFIDMNPEVVNITI